MIFLAAKTAIKEPKRSSALVRRETFASYCFLLPSLIFFLGFVIYPMILCVVTRFFVVCQTFKHVGTVRGDQLL